MPRFVELKMDDTELVWAVEHQVLYPVSMATLTTEIENCEKIYNDNSRNATNPNTSDNCYTDSFVNSQQSVHASAQRLATRLDLNHPTY